MEPAYAGREIGEISLTVTAKYPSTIMSALKALNDGLATDGGQRMWMVQPCTRLCQGRLLIKQTKPDHQANPEPRSMKTAEHFQLVGALAFTHDTASFNWVAFIVIDARAGKPLRPD